MAIEKEDYDEFVQSLVSNPANPPRLIIMNGFLGESTEAGCVRLYLDAALQRYLEIPNDAILYHQKLDKSIAPLGGSRIWVKAEAIVVSARTQQRMSAEFLGGNIMRNFSQGAARVNLGAGALTNIDPSWIDGCPTMLFSGECPPTWTVFETINNTCFGPNCISLIAADTCDLAMCVPTLGGGGGTLQGGSQGVNCESGLVLDCLPPDVLGRVQAQIQRNFWRQARR